MNPDPFPPDLPDLEQWLTRRSCPEPGAGLRDRILTAARAEQRLLARSRGTRAWGLAWRAAAAVVLALNVALSAANGFRYQALPVRAAGPAEVAPLAETPDRREPFAASAVARLTPAPDVEAIARRFFKHKEN
jgi:hypothetical protein